MKSAISSVVLLLFLFGANVSLAQEHPTVSAQANTVYVGADGKFEAAPDTAQIQFNVSVQDETSQAAFQRASKNVEQVRQVLRANGIDPKSATFGFLYYVFMIRNLNKVYIHSRDVNIRNINLNSRFGFELEGVFLNDVRVGDKHQDVLRMALFKSLWLQIFSDGA